MNNGVDSVLVEGGRATADPQSGVIRYNFYNSPSRLLTSATWFVKEEKSQKEVWLKPMQPWEEEHLESLYQKAIEATSSLGKGLDSVLNEEHFLEDDDCKIVIHKSGTNTLSMKKKPKGWFGTTFDLQRGYSEYSIEGEDEETTLGPVAHVIFVVHGIGQALLNREDIKYMTLIEEMDAFRLLIQRRQLAEWKRLCEKAQKSGTNPPPVPNRVEILPIEWWDQIHNSSSALVRSLRATTLPTIPGLRAIANDVVFDVLMYLTPTFCETVLSCVTNQLNDLYHGVKKVHPDFIVNGGKFSLVGHSLGSVIVWDLLSILKSNTESAINIDGDLHFGVHLPGSGVEVGYQAYAAKTDQQEVNARDGSWGPSLSKPMSRCIPFIPEFTIFLGSPLGMFLSLRGAHAVFNEMLQMSISEVRAKAAEVAAEVEDMVNPDVAKMQELQAKLDFIEEPITSPFTLPSGSVYNIFHPSDPVAYRIEPLLLAEGISEADLPPPRYLTKRGEKVRLHVQAKQLGDDFVKSFQERKNSIQGFFMTAIQAVAAMHALTDKDKISKRHSSTELKQGPLSFALGGRSDRMDYSIQPGVIENEYLSAVSAHSNYFVNPDVIDFIIDLTSPSEAKDHDSINSLTF
jgi:phospholipase DDHD2